MDKLQIKGINANINPKFINFAKPCLTSWDIYHPHPYYGWGTYNHLLRLL